MTTFKRIFWLKIFFPFRNNRFHLKKEKNWICAKYLFSIIWLLKHGLVTLHKIDFVAGRPFSVYYIQSLHNELSRFKLEWLAGTLAVFRRILWPAEFRALFGFLTVVRDKNVGGPDFQKKKTRHPLPASATTPRPPALLYRQPAAFSRRQLMASFCFFTSAYCSCTEML